MSVPQLEIGQINDHFLTVQMKVKLARKTLAAKNVGVAVRVDIRDRLLYLTWNSRIADRLANV